MSNLQKLPPTLDSREVAEMVGMRHADLMRNIDHYIDVMGQNAKLRFDDFFIKQTYTAGTGKQYKRYDITKQGCEMVANKLTGERGLQEKRGKDWHLTERGKAYGEAKPYERGGHSGYQIMWRDEVIAALKLKRK